MYGCLYVRVLVWVCAEFRFHFSCNYKTSFIFSRFGWFARPFDYIQLILLAIFFFRFPSKHEKKKKTMSSLIIWQTKNHNRWKSGEFDFVKEPIRIIAPIHHHHNSVKTVSDSRYGISCLQSIGQLEGRGVVFSRRFWSFTSWWSFGWTDKRKSEYNHISCNQRKTTTTKKNHN